MITLEGRTEKGPNKNATPIHTCLPPYLRQRPRVQLINPGPALCCRTIRLIRDRLWLLLASTARSFWHPGWVDSTHMDVPILMISQAAPCSHGSSLVSLGSYLTFPGTTIATGCHRVLKDHRGLTGGNMAVTQAYVSDITTHEEKG